ncbi:uncharacterized protein LODBEIA_P34040 [Lodderomyces beijingensis]|uniref:FAD/NAD(P)-binding domain-containing protein n=1 Tax=Lodderomyces beijingensis TaxID=1775926 RepID=A0ABP0ZSI3_9ASCO
MSLPKIDSVAIIGAGPAGLSTLYEFLHTNKDGTSTLVRDQTQPSKSDFARSTDPAFGKVVVFEQKAHAGGIWAPYSARADLDIPPQDILNTEKYSDPSYIRPRQDVVTGGTLADPVVQETSQVADELRWSRSGVFPFLYTNIPQRFTRFSYLPLEEEYFDEQRKIFPFLTQQELSARFGAFVEREKLGEFIRVNSTVESVVKNNQTGKWVVSVRESHNDEHSGHHEDRWYSEEFDAVVVANGHYTVPYIPHIPGLAEYNVNFPDRLIHAKSFRTTDEFKNKDVLVVGGGISTANVLQYVVPVAKSTTNSKRGKHLVFKYINDALVSEGIDPKPLIERVDPQTGVFYFGDGTNGKFDKVLFSTGYHYHFPFFQNDQEYLQLVNPGNLSRVGGLYLNTFSQVDPTLGAVGITVSQLNFHTIEASSSALAGVWSGRHQLPPVEEQKKWEDELVAERGDSLFFHYFNQYEARQYIDWLKGFFPGGRYDPLIDDGVFVGEIETVGGDKLEKLFYGLKEQRVAIEETNDQGSPWKEGETRQDSANADLAKSVEKNLKINEEASSAAVYA